jgi:hypothetical protein
VRLRAMIESPDRAWIGHRETAQSLASGARMYAYLALRQKLTCAELAMAVEDLESVIKMFDKPLPKITSERAGLVIDLAIDVWSKLKTERQVRCENESAPAR